MQTRSLGPFKVPAIGLGGMNLIIPFPGTTSLARLAQDLAAAAAAAADVMLTPATMAALQALINEKAVTGARYSAQSQGEVDTEEF
jgi:aryl-alcohol dehydrogenase-like predicted oxidoreductase